MGLGEHTRLGKHGRTAGTGTRVSLRPAPPGRSVPEPLPVPAGRALPGAGRQEQEGPGRAHKGRGGGAGPGWEAMALVAAVARALAALALAERSRPYAVLQKQNLGKERRRGTGDKYGSAWVPFCLVLFFFNVFLIVKADLGQCLGEGIQILTCPAPSSRSAAGQHPQRPGPHHHPHGRLRLQAGPAAIAEREPGAAVGKRCRFSCPVLLPGSFSACPTPLPPAPGLPRCRVHGSLPTQHRVAPS